MQPGTARDVTSVVRRADAFQFPGNPGVGDTLVVQLPLQIVARSDKLPLTFRASSNARCSRAASYSAPPARRNRTAAAAGPRLLSGTTLEGQRRVFCANGIAPAVDLCRFSVSFDAGQEAPGKPHLAAPALRRQVERFESRTRLAGERTGHVGVDEVVFHDAQSPGQLVVLDGQLVEALGILTREETQQIAYKLVVVSEIV